MSFDAIDNEAESESSSTNEYSDAPRLGMQPRSAIKGEIVSVGFTGNPYATQNVKGAAQDDVGDFVFTLKNPEVMLGDCFQARGRDQVDSGLIREHRDAVDMEWEPGDDYAPIIDAFYDLDEIERIPKNDYQLVDPDGDNVSSNVEKVDGEFTEIGIEYGPVGNEYPTANGAPTTTVDEDVISVFQGSGAGRVMMQALEATQGKAAYIDDNNEKVLGMMEYPRDYGTDSWSPSEGDYPRVALDNLKLHPELEGEEIVLYLRFGDSYQGNRAHHGEVLLADAADPGDMTRLTAKDYDAEEPRADLYDERDLFLQFHEPDGGWEALGDSSQSDSDDGDTSTDDESSTDDTSQSSGGNDLDFDELDDSDDGDDADGPTVYEELSPDEQTFVDGVVTHADNSDAPSADAAFSRDFSAIVQAAIDDGDLPSDASADALEQIVDEQIAAGVVPT